MMFSNNRNLRHSLDLTGFALESFDASATLGNALIYIFPGLMFRGAIHKLENANKMQRVEVKIGLTSAAIGALLGISK
jgi:hypothetical protein